MTAAALDLSAVAESKGLAVRACEDLLQHGLTEDGLAVSNPANGQRLGVVRSWSAGELPALIEAADRAQQDWAARTAKGRGAVLRRWNDLVLERKDDLARLVTAESGKPYLEALDEVA